MSEAGIDTARAAASDQGGADARASDAALLRATGIHKSYRMGSTNLVVLRDCSLSVAPGEFVAIMGKSGSGKSTLLHVLGALDVPQRGQVLFRDRQVFAPPEGRRLRTSIFDVFSAAETHRNQLRRTQFGFVFQFYHLLPELTVLENVLLPRLVSESIFAWRSCRAAARAHATQLLESVGLGGRLTHKPAELSGGERQRVALARDLVHKPKILLADEPTGNLDAESGGNIMAILQRVHRDGQTIVMVTHDPGIARSADRILQLVDGKLRVTHETGDIV